MSEKNHKTLVWFRNDLRLADNPALYYAAEQGAVLPVYIFDEEERPLGKDASDWLLSSLHDLRASLKEKKADLLVLKGKPQELLPSLVKAYALTDVFWNRAYDKYSVQRDKNLKSTLQNDGVTCHTFKANLIVRLMN